MRKIIMLIFASFLFLAIAWAQDSTFNDSSGDFGSPSEDFSSPSEDFSSPSEDFSAPSSDFSAPEESFSDTSDSFSTPSQTSGVISEESTGLESGPSDILENSVSQLESILGSPHASPAR